MGFVPVELRLTGDSVAESCNELDVSDRSEDLEVHSWSLHGGLDLLVPENPGHN